MNVQNIPRSDKVIKRAFVPKLDYLVSFDYDAIEYRFLAYFLGKIGHTQMAKDFWAGRDPHCVAAVDLGLFDLRAPHIAMPDEIRQKGKTFNFAVIFGGGLRTIMAQLECSPREARTLYDAYHAARPGIRILTNPPDARGTQRGMPGLVEQVVADRGYLTTLWGRHLVPQSPHKGLNAIIQGSAADLMRAAMVRCHKWAITEGLRSHIVNVIHDDLMWDAPAEELPHLAANVPALMSDPRLEEILPITVGCEVSSTTWADKAPYLEELAA